MSASLGEIEELFAESIVKIGDINGMMKTVLATQATLAKSHSDIATAFTLMAKTFEKSEQRQERLEDTNNKLYREKGVPFQLFLMVVASLCGVIILVAVQSTDTFVKATLTSFEAGKKLIIKENSGN